MSLTDEQVGVIQPVASGIAISLKRSFGMVDREDLEQECWVWAVSHPRKVAEYIAEDELGKLGAAMRNAARKWALKEKAAHEGYHVDDLHFYSVKELGTLVGVVLDDREAWATPPSNGRDKVSGGDPAVGNNWLALLSDVSRAYDRLPDEDRDVLALRFGADGEEKMVLRELAEEYGVTISTVHKRVTKALERLQEELGGPRPEADEPDREYTGTKHRMSNAEALATIEGLTA